METFSVWHWAIVLLFAAVVIVPFWRILPRSGLPAWLAIFAVIPIGWIVLLWIVAFKRWPQDA